MQGKFNDIKRVKKVIKITSRTTVRPFGLSEVKVLRQKAVIQGEGRSKPKLVAKKHLVYGNSRLVIPKQQATKVLSQKHKAAGQGVKHSTKKVAGFRAWTLPRVMPSRYVWGVALSIFLLLSTYLSGIWTGLSTSKSYAEYVFSSSDNLAAKEENLPAGLQVLPMNGTGQLPLKLTENNLFAMPLDRLEDAFTRRQAEMTELMFNERAEKIKNYLNEKKSPFAEYASIIARQPHWQLILAIGFAESSWGKNCVDNNCSNIGVKPGHELWRDYENYGEWIKDFNKLLERRYKDWTLKEMCGVYVKPCNKNWMSATTQVLGELKESNIN